MLTVATSRAYPGGVIGSSSEPSGVVPEDTQLPAARTLNVAMSSPAGVTSLLQQNLDAVSLTLWGVVATGSPKVTTKGRKRPAVGVRRWRCASQIAAEIIRVLALLSAMDGAEPILINEIGIRGLVQCAKACAQAARFGVAASSG